jgi:hypothetical protein
VGGKKRKKQKEEKNLTFPKKSGILYIKKKDHSGA